MTSRLSIATLRENISYTPKTLRLTWKVARGLTAGLACLTVVGAFLPIAVVYVGKMIIDSVVAGDVPSTISRVGLELGIIVFQGLVIRSLSLLRQLLGARLSVEVNLQILEKANTLELWHFEDPKFYDQLTRARREASMRPLAVIADTFLLIQNIMTLGGYITLLISYNPWAVLALFLSAIPATLIEMHFSNTAFQLRNWRSPETRRLNYLEHILGTDTHAKEVILFNLGPYFLQRYRAMGEKLFAEDQQLAIKRTTWSYSLSLIATLAFYGCYLMMASAAAAGQMTLGFLTLYVASFRQGQQAFQSILTAIGGMYENNLYMSNLFTFLAIPTTSVPPIPLPDAHMEEKNAGISFENVSFKYPDQEQWVLKGLNLFIPKGQSLALVGHNGAGKTTFTKLLTRLYKPTTGRILIDGIDLQDWDGEVLRKRLSVIFQDFNRYHLSFRENVTLGNVDFMTDDARFDRAILSGGAKEIASVLPKKDQTTLGRWFKEGTELSGGQWQKVALARAYMREDADILILDEPTAALDAESEFAVFERFQALTKGRTTILISHRFPTVRLADKIVVIEGGVIVEQGTHDELIAKDGRYAQLFKLQARGYL